MEISHNMLLTIIDGDVLESGTYRVLVDAPSHNRTVLVRLTTASSASSGRGGRKKSDAPTQPRKKSPPPLVGELIWVDRQELRQLDPSHLREVQLEPDAIYLSPIETERDKEIYGARVKAMQGFLDYANLREQILACRTTGNLVREAMRKSGLSRSLVYKLFSQLCRFGFTESSLRPRRDRCGAPGIARPCDPGGRKKAGAKTVKQRLARAYGEDLPPEQPGMSTEWRTRILAADTTIPIPKPPMPERCTTIHNSAFIKTFRMKDGQLVEVDPERGTYPTPRQIRRVMEQEYSELERLRQKTTLRHFAINRRGLTGKSWQGVSGPGHTWAIDSTVGDIYLRSSVDRSWIIGRPIVYVIVDVWSTAVVGFYVCLMGPSWDMAKIALFCSTVDPALMAELWGYQAIFSLDPAPTMCTALLCDRGEYLSVAASQTGAKLIPIQSYAAPYRADGKGIVEVLHRIEKDHQYFLLPGAIDARRKEYELRQFNPARSVLTVREFVACLQIEFTKYNLAADRRNRFDAHMVSDGGLMSPAALWRWGHAAGIGVRRTVPQSQLVWDLLPEGMARVARYGVKYAGGLYSAPEIVDGEWATYARNLGGWDLESRHFPGSVSRIWVSNVGRQGLLDLRLSDQSVASAATTFDEVADAFAYRNIRNAEIEHERLKIVSGAQRNVKKLVAQAQELTKEAEASHAGAKPSITEARALEHSPRGESAEPNPAPKQYDADAMAAHLAMMRSVLESANGEGDE